MKKKKMTIPAEMKAAASAFGRLGGQSGSGAAKARGNAREAARIRWARRDARRAAALKGWEKKRRALKMLSEVHEAAQSLDNIPPATDGPISP